MGVMENLLSVNTTNRTNDYYNSMTPKYEIKVKYHNVEYLLKIYRKITIIKGNSATGKSFLLKLLDKKSNIGEIDITTNVDIRILSNPSYDTILTTNWDMVNVVFLDENNYIFQDRKSILRILESNAYLVIISRENFKKLEYSVSDIYEFKSYKENEINSELNRRVQY